MDNYKHFFAVNFFAGMNKAEAISALEHLDVQRETLPYNANILPAAAYRFISDYQSVLIDVRTDAEWNYVGVPELSQTVSQFMPLSWMLYPDYTKNQQFATQLQSQITDKDTPLFFLCKVGGRSAQAAASAAALGYAHCYNIIGGFEGELSAEQQRSSLSGWKVAGLPWKQA